MRHTFLIDGSIRWFDKTADDAADSFDLEARQIAIYDWVRQFRGGVIAGASEIERNLDLFLVLYFLDRSGSRKKLQEFSQCFLENLSLERKCQAMLRVLKSHNPAKAKELSKQLQTIRDMRNATAHRPFWMELVVSEEGKIVGLIPFITKGSETIALTTELVEEMNELIPKAIEGAKSAIQDLELTEANQ